MAFKDYWSPKLGFLQGLSEQPEEQDMKWYVDPWTQKLRDIQMPKLQESYYNIPTTGVQSGTASALENRLGRSVEDIKPSLGPEAAQQYYAAEKARRQEGYGEQQDYLKNILNREGVLTSSPGITAQTKLATQQGKEMEAFGSQLMYEDIARDIEATKMAEDIMQNAITQGISLGGQQSQQAQWPYQMAQTAMGQAQGMESYGYLPEAKVEHPGWGQQDVEEMMAMLMKAIERKR